MDCINKLNLMNAHKKYYINIWEVRVVMKVEKGKLSLHLWIGLCKESKQNDEGKKLVIPQLWGEVTWFFHKSEYLKKEI